MVDLRVYYNNVPRLCTPGYSRLLTPGYFLRSACLICVFTTTCPAYAHIATLAAVFCARQCVRVHVHRAWALSVVYQLSGIQLSGHSGMQLV